MRVRVGARVRIRVRVRLMARVVVSVTEYGFLRLGTGATAGVCRAQAIAKAGSRVRVTERERVGIRCSNIVSKCTMLCCMGGSVSGMGWGLGKIAM